MRTRLKKKRYPLSREKTIEEFVAASAKRNSYLLISVLEDTQEYYHYLPEEALRAVARILKIPLRDVYGVATFYRAFRLKPCGQHLVSVCLGTACHVRGGQRVLESLEKDLQIKAGETTKDNNFTLETVNCLGACALGPIMVVDRKYYGNMSPTKAVAVLRKEGLSKGKEKRDEKN